MFAAAKVQKCNTSEMKCLISGVLDHLFYIIFKHFLKLLCCVGIKIRFFAILPDLGLQRVSLSFVEFSECA